jgi:hypothetical protein
MVANRGYLAISLFSQWFIVNSMEPNLAWSGSRWVAHVDGLPAEQVQIRNFYSKEAASKCAHEAHILLVNPPKGSLYAVIHEEGPRVAPRLPVVHSGTLRRLLPGDGDKGGPDAA